MRGVGIYKAEIVKQIHNFYGDLLIRRNEFLTINLSLYSFEKMPGKEIVAKYSAIQNTIISWTKSIFEKRT